MNLKDSISIMTDEIATVLVGSAPSVYLYGSVVLDDFKQGWSDIDILVLTKAEIPQAQAERLVGLRQAMAERFPDSSYFRLFEGGMLSLDAFLAEKCERTVYWGTSGQRINNGYTFDSFGMAQLLDDGVLLHGAEVRGQMTLPTYARLRGDVARHLRTIREHARATDANLYAYGWLLDIARCIYTLRTGEIIAKTAAGEWALQNGICPVPDALRGAVEVRKAPAARMAQEETLREAERLGPYIQRFADVLEQELVMQ